MDKKSRLDKYKINEEFEHSIARILELDPQGVILFSNSFPFCQSHLARIKSILGDNKIKRIRWYPSLEKHVFLNLVSISDVCLDPFPFGGLISTIDMFSCGRTIITLPGEKLYGRFTSGLYKVMGLTKIKNVIAQNIDEYIEKAILLANCSKLRESIENEIIDLLPNIFEDKNTTDEWSTFLHNLA